MIKILLLAVIISQFCPLPAQTNLEFAEKTSGKLASESTKEDSLVTMLLELVSGDDVKKESTITKLAQTGDPRLENFFELYRQGSVYNWPDAEGVPRIVVNEETVMDEDFNEFAPLLDPLSGEPFLVNGQQAKPDLLELEDISPGRKLRKLVNASKFLIRLFSPDYETRISGVKKSGDPPFLEDALPALKEIAEDSSEDEKIRWTARESIALIGLGRASANFEETEERLVFLEELGDLNSLRALARLESFKTEITELGQSGAFSSGDEVRFSERIAKVESSLTDHADSVELSGNLFRGLSYGSVLILIALGLAVTFGLMGVINMAHGELVMIGAYATYEVQRIMGHSADNAADHYYMIALPVAFLASASVGLLMEQFVVRHLYNRPLESLLATWGVGYILIQLVRLRYGDNIGVNAPTWARGGFEITQDVVLPYARLYLLGLSGTCVAFLYCIIRKTKMGVLIRATMQNRDMAQSLGVRTRNVDRFTFAMGAGIAGVAGYGWTIVGGVTPDMGSKLFIVDSFLVVVTGGVGELAGVLFSGLGIGVLTKLIEPMEFGDFTIGPVWGKVILLALIVAFIQFRPAGLFAPKGRLADRK